jgi:tRNA G37 N-methylase TrmD
MTEPTDNHLADPNTPIVCTAGAAQAATQVREWSGLQRQAVERQPIDGGARLVLPAHLAEQVQDLARREAGCCSFLTICTTIDGDRLTVDVTATDDGARPVIAMLSGAAQC